MTIVARINTHPGMTKGDAFALRSYLERVINNEYPTPHIIACDTSVMVAPGRFVDGVTVLHFRCDTLAGAQSLIARTGARSVLTDPPQGPLPEGQTTRTVTAVWHALYFKIKYEEK